MTPTAACEPRSIRSTQAELAALGEAIIAVVDAYKPISLRGVYYQLLPTGLINKTEQDYKRVGRELKKLRRSGLVPYSSITDGTRLIRKPTSWSGLDDMFMSAARTYRRAIWADQPCEVIVLSEKDAITGTVYPVTAELDVELGIVRGYSSETFTHSIAQTVLHNDTNFKTTFIYQLGDHDPSGVDAWRSFQQQVLEFVGDCDVRFQRLAVTQEQIEQYQLPTRPTKTTDTRAKGFIGESVEVDALAPTVLRALVRNAIEQHLDPDVYDYTRSLEVTDRQELTNIAYWAAS